jgi:aspartate-semialdehyde dehydrogenase
MKGGGQTHTLAVVGASTLLGKEILAVLKARAFPVARILTTGGEEAAPDLPVLDLGASYEADIVEEGAEDFEPDYVFLADRLRPARDGAKPGLLHSAERLAAAEHSKVIDLGGFMAPQAGGALRIPVLERDWKPLESGDGPTPRYYVAPHPAVVVIARLLLALASRFPVESAVGEAFTAASEIGPSAIAELQKQTLNLLSFQKIPQAVFGAQMAFNMLPRLGRGRPKTGEPALLERRIRDELREYLGGRVPLPALRVVQAPVFHSLAVSLYVRTRESARLTALGEALAAPGVRLRRLSEGSPSQVEVTGSSDILVDALTPDPAHPEGFWIWAVADNLRLAAVNAVEIAECLKSGGP